MSNSMTEMQALEIIMNIMEGIPNENVYGTMRSMKLKRIKTPGVNYMRACLALHKVNLPITTRLVATLANKKLATTLSALHGLGDKHCLVLKRSDAKRGYYEWVVDPVFLEAYR